MTTNVFKTPGRAVEITSNIATAAGIRNPENVKLTVPDVI